LDEIITQYVKETDERRGAELDSLIIGLGTETSGGLFPTLYTAPLKEGDEFTDRVPTFITWTLCL
jgi:hypothetical protein